MAADDEAERMAAGDRRSVVEDARRLASKTGLPTEGDEFDALLYELQRSLVRALGDCAREWEADFSGRLRMSEKVEGLPPEPGPASVGETATGADKLLSEAVAQYLADGKDRKAWAPKTLVCSDETAGEAEDSLAAHTSEIGVPASPTRP